MPDPNLQAYLAQHYLSGPKADAILARQGQSDDQTGKTKKKKRRKISQVESGPSSSSGGNGRLVGGRDAGGLASLRVRDDDDDFWKGRGEEEEEEDGVAQVVREERGPKFKKGGWTSLGPDDQAADKVESMTQNEEGDGEDQAPQLVGHDGLNLDATASELAQVQRQEDEERRKSQQQQQQPLSGLRTKEQVRADRLAREEAQRREEQDRLASKGSQDEEEEDSQALREARLAQTTVYRDERGRRIDVEAEDEILRKEEERRRRKEKEKKEWNKGERQREDERKRQRELDLVKGEGVARYASDARMNAELRAMERADDPALAFLTKKRPKGPQLPRYRGPPPPPNRFGIPPGYRWDGVDRGNGFEKKLFEARGARVRREQDERAYGTSDM